MTTHDIPALEAAYRNACVRYCEAMGDAEVDRAMLHVHATRDALQRAKAASEQGLLDEDIQLTIRHILYDRPAVVDDRHQNQIVAIKAALAAMRAAGYRVTKEQQTHGRWECVKCDQSFDIYP